MAKKKKTKKKTARKTRKSASRDVLCVGSKVKAYVKSQGGKSSGELVGAVSDAVYGILDQAISRSQANKRATVKPTDL